MLRVSILAVSLLLASTFAFAGQAPHGAPPASHGSGVTHPGMAPHPMNPQSPMPHNPEHPGHPGWGGHGGWGGDHRGWEHHHGWWRGRECWFWVGPICVG